jgi:hypothetical protein
VAVDVNALSIGKFSRALMGDWQEKAMSMKFTYLKVVI